MLRDFGRAKKRAAEVRDELVGVVLREAPVNDVKEKLASTVVAPLAQARDSLTSSWNTGVNSVFSSVSGAASGAAPGAASGGEPKTWGGEPRTSGSEPKKPEQKSSSLSEFSSPASSSPPSS
jgi:hypothetical protein